MSDTAAHRTPTAPVTAAPRTTAERSLATVRRRLKSVDARVAANRARLAKYTNRSPH